MGEKKIMNNSKITMTLVSKTTSKIIETSRLKKWSINNMNGHFIMKSSHLLSFLMSNNAIALVDERLAGEGTGQALGINNPILGWVLVSVFTAVWGVYYISTKDLGGQREEDGLGL